MKRIASGVAFALMLAPAFAHAEEKSTTTTTAQETKTTSKDAQGTAANPMSTPDTQKSSSATSDEKMTDARLVTLLQKVNKEEIEAGKLAQKRGKSADIRKYGKTLITDHTRSQKEVAAAAKKAKVTPGDSALTMKDKEQEKIGKNKMDQLKRLNGSEFDKTFAQVMSSDHEHMISLLKDHKDDLESDDLKTLVDNTIPVLEQHKELADKAMSQESRASAGSSQDRSPQGRSAPTMDRSSSSPDKSSHSGTGDDPARSSAPNPDKK